MNKSINLKIINKKFLRIKSSKIKKIFCLINYKIKKLSIPLKNKSLKNTNL